MIKSSVLKIRVTQQERAKLESLAAEMGQDLSKYIRSILFEEETMITIARSYVESGNLTRGQYGDIPRPVPVTWDEGEWKVSGIDVSHALKSPEKYTWGAWDTDYGWMAPWPSSDVQAEPVWYAYIENGTTHGFVRTVTFDDPRYDRHGPFNTHGEALKFIEDYA